MHWRAFNLLPGPAAANLVVGVERHPERVEFPRFLGVPHHNLADLIGDLRPTAADELVVDPCNDDHVAVPTVAKALTQFIVHPNEPALADDRLGAGHDPIEGLVLRVDRHAAPVEPQHPSLPRGLRLQALAQLL